MRNNESRKNQLSWYRKLCYPHNKFKSSTNSWSVSLRVHRVIEYNQEAWLKQYIDMNTKLKKRKK